MAAAEASSSPNPPRPDLRRRQRRLVFDRRYGWIFDEWTDPAVAALSGGRGMLVFARRPPALQHTTAAFFQVLKFYPQCPRVLILCSLLCSRFCVLPMAQSLMSAAAYSVDYATDSVSAALKRPDIFSPLAYLPHLQLHRKQQTWFDGLERSGVVADTKLIPCSTL
ncbi:uncharacterized protein [Triticum aestivum]|uniref:uncharacterized protein isoform X1 n=1 Tax=Triticum aestivum TaxID=4565 RepID=UPI001D00AAB6|nr:uncharacterized protein LOC123102954 isoform X1 [Triticum aestivum]